MSLGAFGALAGIGQGIATIGQGMYRDSVEAEERKAKMELERMRQAEITARNNDNLDTKVQLAEMRSQLASGRAGAGKGGVSLSDLMKDPPMLAAHMGVPLEKAQRFIDVTANGANQMVDAGTVLDDEYGEQRIQAPKYQPGEGDRIAAEGHSMLWAAMGLANPGQADDLAKARNSLYVTDAAQRYEQGDLAAYDGAMAALGKSPYSNEGTHGATGLPVGGSVDDAQAKKYEAEAGNIGKTSSRDEINRLREDRMAIKDELAVAQKVIDSASETLKTTYDKSEKTRLQKSIEAQREIISEGQKRYRTLGIRIERLSGGSDDGALPAIVPPRSSLAGAGRGDADQAAVDPRRVDRAESPASAASAAEMARAEAVSTGQDVRAKLGGREIVFEGGTGREKGRADAPGAANGPAEPRTRAEYDALPRGALYRKDGKTYRKG